MADIDNKFILKNLIRNADTEFMVIGKDDSCGKYNNLFWCNCSSSTAIFRVALPVNDDNCYFKDKNNDFGLIKKGDNKWTYFSDISDSIQIYSRSHHRLHTIDTYNFIPNRIFYQNKTLNPIPSLIVGKGNKRGWLLRHEHKGQLYCKGSNTFKNITLSPYEILHFNPQCNFHSTDFGIMSVIFKDLKPRQLIKKNLADEALKVEDEFKNTKKHFSFDIQDRNILKDLGYRSMRSEEQIRSNLEVLQNESFFSKIIKSATNGISKAILDPFRPLMNIIGAIVGVLLIMTIIGYCLKRKWCCRQKKSKGKERFEGKLKKKQRIQEMEKNILELQLKVDLLSGENTREEINIWVKENLEEKFGQEKINRNRKNRDLNIKLNNLWKKKNIYPNLNLEECEV